MKRRLVRTVACLATSAALVAAGNTTTGSATAGDGETEPNAIKSMLDRAAAPPASVFAWHVDATTNQVIVYAEKSALSAAREFVRSSGAEPALIHVETGDRRPTLRRDLRGGVGWGPGLSDTCSTGFSISSMSEPDTHGYVTAGHCGDAGQDAWATVNGARISQGVVRASTFPGQDRAWVATDSEWTPRPLVSRHGAGDAAVAGWREADVGAQICRSGMITGWRCGTIQAKNVTLNFPEGQVFGLTKTSACSANGDSGGPVLAGDQAQGIVVAGSGNCTSGGNTYFQRIVPILASYRLKLAVTGTSSTPPVITSLSCDYFGNLAFQCLVGYYHPDGVQIRWTVNGVPKPAWDNETFVSGNCPGSRTSVKVTVSNSSGSASTTHTIHCDDSLG